MTNSAALLPSAPAGARSRRMPSLAGAIALGAASVGFVVPAAASPDVVDPVVVEFDVPGASDWTVPAGVTEISVVVDGAAGGDSAAAVRSPIDGSAEEFDVTATTAPGGLGGRTTATLAVSPGETLEVLVGSAGGDGTVDVASAMNYSGGAAGQPDGGQGVATGSSAIYEGVQGAFRVASAAGGGGGWSSVLRGTERLVVAGGGGGGGGSAFAHLYPGGPSAAPSSSGGAGGGAVAGDGEGIDTGSPGVAGGGGGATSSAPGAAGVSSTGGTGTPGDGPKGASTGGYGGSTLARADAVTPGAGGGGYFGGGSGASISYWHVPGADPAPPAVVGAGGGGGGSGFGPAGAVLEAGVNAGHGSVTISYLPGTDPVDPAPADPGPVDGNPGPGRPRGGEPRPEATPVPEAPRAPVAAAPRAGRAPALPAAPVTARPAFNG